MIGGHLLSRLFAIAAVKPSSHCNSLWARSLSYLCSPTLGPLWAPLRTRISQRAIATGASRGHTIKASIRFSQASNPSSLNLAHTSHPTLSLHSHPVSLRGLLLGHRFSSKPSSPPRIDPLPSSTPPPAGRRGMGQKLKDFLRQYGKLGVVVYFSISAITFGTIYVALRTGVDVKALVASLGLPASTLWDGAGTLAVAYAIYKVLMPLRIFLAIGATTWIAKRTRFGARLTGGGATGNTKFINQHNGDSTSNKP